MPTPDVMAQQNPGAGYDDADLRQKVFQTLYNRGGGNFAADAVQQIRNYIESLSPQQLLERAQGLNQGAGGQDLSGFLGGRYSGVNYQGDVSNIQALKSFKSIMGRDPTAEEYAQVTPIFNQSNGQQYGNAWLSQYKQQYDQNPANRVNDAGKYSGQLNQTFQSMLGRGATQDEINHFGSLLATGNVDAYQLQDFLRGTPEYQQGQDKQFRSGLDQELQNSDTKFFDRNKQGVISQFMRNGTGNSSALDSALADMLGQIAEKRGNFLSSLSSQQYGANKDLALKNYAGARDQYFGDQAYNRGQAQKQQDYYQGRSDNLTDYNRQMQDYLNNYNGQKQSGGGGGMGAFGGAISGAGAGAALGPWGAAGGAVAGGLYGYLNNH